MPIMDIGIVGMTVDEPFVPMAVSVRFAGRIVR
jgi:hypothetical protein